MHALSQSGTSTKSLTLGTILPYTIPPSGTHFPGQEDQRTTKARGEIFQDYDPSDATSVQNLLQV